MVLTLDLVTTMATLEFLYIADRGEVLAASAFDRVVGTEGFLTDKSRTVIGHCGILSVTVAAGGGHATWTVEVTELTGPADGPILLAWPSCPGSLAFTAARRRPGQESTRLRWPSLACPVRPPRLLRFPARRTSSAAAPFPRG